MPGYVFRCVEGDFSNHLQTADGENGTTPMVASEKLIYMVVCGRMPRKSQPDTTFPLENSANALQDTIRPMMNDAGIECYCLSANEPRSSTYNEKR